MELYVAARGKKGNCGTKDEPLGTIQEAIEKVRASGKVGLEAIHIKILEGIYYLKEPIIFTTEDSGSKEFPVAYEGIGNVIISGGMPLNLQWHEYKEGIYKASLESKIKFDQLFANGERQIMARYPSYNEDARYYNGYAKDSFDKERVKNYKNPKGGFMHAMHEGLWGDFIYEILDKDNDGSLKYWGGHQNNRPSKMHESIRYIENIFEELTEEKEWFLDDTNWMIYYKPQKDMDIYNTSFSGAILKNLISLCGTKDAVIHDIYLKNLKFENTSRTVMEYMEPLQRSDWRVYRGGAAFIENGENITIDSCDFKQLGGNGIFISKYNKNVTVKRCYIYEVGSSSILLIGDRGVARSPLYSYEDIHMDMEEIDLEPGAQTQEYPRECTICDNLLVRNGMLEKQAAGICLASAANIIISHNTIHDVPRAGINICDGTFGGHIIEYNQVFNTVLETSDHGAFNSWGRNRYWDHRYQVMEKRLEDNPEFPLLDAMEPTILRNNCFACEHGWDIDLDDGSSNYKIYNNLCLKGGIKNREGIKREVYNNIILNNTFHPHVWFKNSKDCFYNNIIFENYADIQLNGWGDYIDYNILHSDLKEGVALELQKKSGKDKHSLYSKIEFVNSVEGDFTVIQSQELETIKFEQVRADEMGTQTQRLKELAKNPFHNKYKINKMKKKDETIYNCKGIKIKNLCGLGELSATGMYQECGVYVIEVDGESKWKRVGLQANDVILAVDERELEDAKFVVERLGGNVNEITVWREQGKHLIFVR